MAHAIFSAAPLYQQTGLAAIRIITGGLMIYHGLEIFDAYIMNEYLKWDVIKSLPAPEAMVYTGKSVELITGFCFVIGLFTRVAALLMAANMLFICFRVGNGEFYYADQHPFIFALLALVFFFTGPGKMAADHVIFNKNSKSSQA